MTIKERDGDSSSRDMALDDTRNDLPQTNTAEGWSQKNLVVDLKTACNKHQIMHGTVCIKAFYILMQIAPLYRTGNHLSLSILTTATTTTTTTIHTIIIRIRSVESLI